MLEIDPASAAPLLKLARMPRFVGAGSTLVDLPGAVRRLGTRNSLLIMRTVVLRRALCTGDAVWGPLSAATWKTMMTTSKIASQAAEAKFKSVISPDRMGILALFQNIGELVLVKAAAQLNNSPHPGVSAGDLAAQAMQSHTDLGDALCRFWNIDDEIRRLVRCHHAPDSFSDGNSDDRFRQLCSLAVLDDLEATQRLGAYFSIQPGYPSRSQCLELLGVSEEEWQEITLHQARGSILQE